MSRPSDSVQGTLDLLLLKILALEPLNGFAISVRRKQVSSDVRQVSDGSLYPALHKLEQKGWVAAEWKPSQVLLADSARSQATTREAPNWTRLSDAISYVGRLEEA